MSDSNSQDLPEITDAELQRRVVYSLFGTVARLAHRYGLPLKEIKGLLEIACYHELKKASKTLKEAASVLGVSRRKIAQLSKRLKQNFFSPEREHGLPRQIEYMLWAGAMGEGRIKQALSEYDDATVEDALEELVRQERIVAIRDDYTTKYAVPDSEFRLYATNWLARIDGLNNLLGNLTDAIVGRFFEGDDRSFARTLNFRMRRRDIPELREMYEEKIYETLKELEERIDEDEQEQDQDEEIVEMSLSTLWAPTDLSVPDE